MSASLSLPELIVEILKHTPLWVWAVLAVITLLGLAQLREHRVPPARLAVAAIGLGTYSLFGATSAFGAWAAVAWLAGLALALAASRLLGRPRAIAVADGDRIAVQGSPWPLLLMWAVFLLRYAVAVRLAVQPALAHATGFAVSVALLFGTLSGLFAARAWRVLQSMPRPIRVAAA